MASNEQVVARILLPWGDLAEVVINSATNQVDLRVTEGVWIERGPNRA